MPAKIAIRSMCLPCSISCSLRPRSIKNRRPESYPFRFASRATNAYAGSLFLCAPRTRGSRCKGIIWTTKNINWHYSAKRMMGDRWAWVILQALSDPQSASEQADATPPPVDTDVVALRLNKRERVDQGCFLSGDGG